MRICYPTREIVNDSSRIGTWTNKHIPVYAAISTNGFSQLVGYVKNLNSHANVLCRGQCDLYESLVPSAKRGNEEDKQRNKSKLDRIIGKLSNDDNLLEYLGLKKPAIAGWKICEKLIIEATLQHYGASTYCLDFVDEYRTALWFGIHRWDKQSRKYVDRTNEQVVKKSCPISLATIPREHREYAERIDLDNEKGHMYFILYVAETSNSSVNGVYLGNDTYVVDLRRALPSYFLRPCNQCGWIVRGKDEGYTFEDNIACIIRINIELAKKLLGDSSLAEVASMFPTAKEDEGYRYLLMRQDGSACNGEYDPIIDRNILDTSFETVSILKD